MTPSKLSLFNILAIVLGLIIVSTAQAGDAMIKPEAVPAYRPKLYPFDSGEKARRFAALVPNELVDDV